MTDTIDPSLKLRYIKKLKQLTSKRSDRGILALTTGRALRLDDVKSSEVELQLKEEGLISEPSNSPGSVMLTENGYLSIKENVWLRKKYQYLKNGFTKNFTPILNEYWNSIFYGILLFLGFEVIEPFISLQLSEFWVKKVIYLYHPTIYFDILLLIISGILIFLNFKRKLKTWDFFFIAVFIKYRFFNSVWQFWPFFRNSKLEKVNFLYIDILGIYYFGIVGYTVYKLLKEKIASIPKTYKDGFFYPDLSLNRLSNKCNESIYELDSKGLNRNKFASQISDVIGQIKPFQAFAIGICGPWGSGKTSLIDLIVQNLKNGKEVKNYIFLDFSPWLFNNSEMLIASFFSLLEKKFQFNKSLASELKAYGKEISFVEKSLLKTEFTKFLFEKEKSLKERYESIVRQIQDEDKILIITIDDLDRLDKKEIVDVFRLIRLIADFPNTFYLVGYDRGYINSAIEHELTKYKPEKYAEKIFNVEFKTPELTADIIKERLKQSIENQIRILGSKAGRIYAPELANCFVYFELDKFIKNERNIKQFTNNLMMRYLSIKEEVNFYNFFLLELIYYKDASIFNHLYESREAIFKSYKDIVSGNSESDAIGFDSLLNLSLPSEIKAVLEELFKPDSHLTRYSVANELYFLRYFSLSLLSNDFTTDELDAIFNLATESLQFRLVEFNTLNSPLLREKLHNKYLDRKISDEEQLIKTVDAFLFLYNEVFHSKDDKALTEGLNANNLMKFIFEILNNSNQNSSFLEERLLSQHRVQDFAAFSFLISAENIYLIEGKRDVVKRKELFLSFREIQLKFLKLEVQNANGKINNRIINQFQRLRGFSLFDKDNASSQEYINWFTNHVIIGFKDFILANLDGVIDFIKLSATDHGEFILDRAKEMSDSIFLDINSLSSILCANGLEKLTDLYIGLDTLKVFPYSFNNQVPLDLNHPECNDHICNDIFELKKGSFFEISIEPINTPYWRFGFRLSRTKEFPPVTISRHVDNYPVIHLSKGQIDIHGDGSDDSPLPNLDLSVYSGAKHEYVEGAIPDYQNGKVTIYLLWNSENVIHIKVSDGNSKKSVKPISLFSDFHYAKISAWADRRTFNISSRIKVLQQINPDSLF
jgi:predicted KAP-like P-loop ATPase